MFPVYDENGSRRSVFRAWVTWSIVAVNVLIAIGLGLLPAIFVSIIAYQFGLVPAFLTDPANPDAAELIIRPEFTLLTYGFIHAKWSHLTSNMLVLWVFGDNVEKAIGHLRFLLFYFLCQIAGGIAHVISEPGALGPAIGASAAASGVVAAYLLVRPRARIVMLVLGVMTVNFPAYLVIVGWLLAQLAEFLIYRDETDIAYWGHFGGFIAGVALILLMHRPSVAMFRKLPRAFFESVTAAAQDRWRALRRAMLARRPGKR